MSEYKKSTHIVCGEWHVLKWCALFPARHSKMRTRRYLYVYTYIMEEIFIHADRIEEHCEEITTV